jgi:HKD family nuclease
MQLEFFDSYPYRALEPDLQTLLLGARRVGAAVAFVTRSGVAFLRQYLKTHPSGKARLVASVRFPTNLQALANLQDDYPGTVFLHTGFQAPLEKDGDRGQFHSKVVLVEMPGTERCIVVGSHNWTQNALQGYKRSHGR